MKYAALVAGTLAAASALVAGGSAWADGDWWPAKIYDFDSGSQKVAEYTPLAKAAKPWNICVLFPHMKDTFWVAVDYGVVEEAKRMGVNMTLYQAGGYENLPKQLSQFDDCMAGNFDAILVGPISEAGLDKKFDEASPKRARLSSAWSIRCEGHRDRENDCRFHHHGRQTGTYLVELSQGQDRQCRHFPRTIRFGLGRDLPRRLQEGGRRTRATSRCSPTSSANRVSRCSSA